MDLPNPSAVEHCLRPSEVETVRTVLGQACGVVNAFVGGKALHTRNTRVERKLRALLTSIAPSFNSDRLRLNVIREGLSIARVAMEREADDVARVVRLRLGQQHVDGAHLDTTDVVTQVFVMHELQRRANAVLLVEAIADCQARDDAAADMAERAGGKPSWRAAKAKRAAEHAKPRPQLGERRRVTHCKQANTANT